MEEEATQPATQIVIDPRRLGQAGSGLSEEDLADILCILHPASTPAYRATQLIYDNKPALTIATDRNVKIRENGHHHDVDSFQLAEQGIDSHDLVLRLSAKVKDPVNGFHFGRNGQRCDFVIGHQDPSRRISNVHFKIFINEFGTLMIEDQSTNGTAVDGILLRGKEKENGSQYRHTLENGSVIILTMTPPEEDWKFLVRIPQRDLESDNDAYQRNLTTYFLRNNQARQEKQARIAGTENPTRGPTPLNLFPNPAGNGQTPADSNLSSMGRQIKEWKGGSKYNKIGFIGKGAFAVVYKLTAKFDGVPYAAKELEKRRFMKNGVLDQKVDMEMKIMRKIQHENVVRYIEHIDWDEYLYIIMEFVPGGDLGSLISRERYLPEDDVKSMARQLLDALKYLHNTKITHRDVKPDNILINSRHPLHVKLTDFGLSKMIDSEETFLRTFCGTLLYCAPEVYSEYREYDEHTKLRTRKDKRPLPGQRYGHAVDIWSLAGVLFYALCGSPPFPVQNGTSYQELLNRIMTEPLDLRPLNRVNISDGGIRFVRSMLHTVPEYRATVEDLEQSEWFTGINSQVESQSQEYSLEDEIDQIGDDDFIDPALEEGASQLSIHERQIEDSETDTEEMDDIDDGVSDVTELLPLEIPESFETSNEDISIDESYGFMKENINPATGRLFGEVNHSALGSSGAVPKSQLNLPLSSRDFRSVTSQDSRNDFAVGQPDSRIEGSFGDLDSTTAFLPTIMAPSVGTATIATIAPAATAIRHPQINDRTTRASSLGGAESMVGHLNMHSPSSATSPVASPAAVSPTPGEAMNPAASLRRPRDDNIDDYELWRPAGIKRRRQSERAIDIPVPASLFWDPKDRSTHHQNYPEMTTTEFADYKDYAESKGEKFERGQNTFDTTMHSFHSSRSPSLSAIERPRSYSEDTRVIAHNVTRAVEPTRDDRRNIMKRDERKLAEVSNVSRRGSENAVADRLLPDTAQPSRVMPSVELDPAALSFYPQPLVGNDFQAPKRILAKFIATADSCLPTLNVNITESVTSWGRGTDNTVRYSNGQETRIPKYAFKVVLFKPGFKHVDPTLKTKQAWQDKNQDMKFFICTKASNGILVNNHKLVSQDPQTPLSEAKYWGELCHGDVIDIWRSGTNSKIFTRLRFECYWGMSKQLRVARDDGFNFCYCAPCDDLDEIEKACLSQEKAILAERERREKTERDVARSEQDRKNLARQRFGEQSHAM